MPQSRFHIEVALQAWRRFMTTDRMLSDEDLDELEAHLRDDIEEAMSGGLNAEEAFRQAVRHLGDYTTIEAAYRAVYWRKQANERRLRDEIAWRAALARNYLRSAWRTLLRYRRNSAINLFGLALGMACFLLVASYVRHEMSFDRFHEDADRVVRVTPTYGDLGRKAVTPLATLEYFKTGFPQIVAVTHLQRWSTVMRMGTEWVEEEMDVFWADSSVFDVFSFPFIVGHPETALREPNTIVLTASMARQYFGDGPSSGQVIALNDGSTLRVTGIMEDVPSNSHLQFGGLASLATLTQPSRRDEQPAGVGFIGYQYMRLVTAEARQGLEQQLNEIVGTGEEADHVLGWWMEALAFELQPLTEVHFASGLSNEVDTVTDARYLRLFSLIAMFILALACINYINLTTAQAARRSREVGIRKVVGGSNGQLAWQFLSESLLLTLGGLILGVGLALMLRPLLTEIMGTSPDLVYDIQTWGWAGAVLLGVGLLAGSYPAFVLALLQPVVVMRGEVRFRSGWLRKGLVTFQFAVSAVLIVATLVMQRQLKYLQEKPLGFDTEQIVQLPLAGALKTQADAFKAEVLRHPEIVGAALASGVPGHGYLLYAIEHQGQVHELQMVEAEPDYLDVMGIELVAGEEITEQSSSDDSGILINETAARVFELEDQIGVPGAAQFGRAYTVLGIVEDFHMASLHSPIKPTVLRRNSEWFHALVVRLGEGEGAAAMTALEEIWKQFSPDEPFRYTFLDEMLGGYYDSTRRTGQLVMAFSMLAVLIACLGLFGLAAFATERRTKEIGLRKVFGAGVASLVGLLSKDFMRLVVLAFLIAAPVAYVAIERWLSTFAYRIEPGAGVFLLAGLMAAAVALLAVSLQAVRAARADPIETLRYE